MNEHNKHQKNQGDNTHSLPRGVIQAGIAGAEAAANQGSEQQPRETMINVDAMVPISAERSKIERFTNKAKDIGRAALEQLPFGGGVTWQPGKEKRK